MSGCFYEVGFIAWQWVVYIIWDFFEKILQLHKFWKYFANLEEKTSIKDINGVQRK